MTTAARCRVAKLENEAVNFAGLRGKGPRNPNKLANPDPARQQRWQARLERLSPERRARLEQHVAERRAEKEQKAQQKAQKKAARKEKRKARKEARAAREAALQASDPAFYELRMQQRAAHAAAQGNGRNTRGRHQLNTATVVTVAGKGVLPAPGSGAGGRARCAAADRRAKVALNPSFPLSEATSMAGTILSPQRGGGLQPGLCLCGSGRPFLQCCGATPPVSRPAVEPDDPQVAALYQAATDAMRAEKAATAKVHLSKLLKLAPEHVDALRLLGRAQKAIGDPAAEEATHQRLLSLQPDNDVLLTDYAGFLYDRQRIHDSAQYSARAVDRNPRNAQAHMLMGLACIKTSTLQRAEYHLRQAQYLQPSNPLANVKLASVLRSLGRMEEARRFYRVTLSLQPGNHEALLGWVKLEEAVKNLEYGWQLLREAERLYPGNPVQHAARGPAASPRQG